MRILIYAPLVVCSLICIALMAVKLLPKGRIADEQDNWLNEEDVKAFDKHICMRHYRGMNH